MTPDVLLPLLLVLPLGSAALSLLGVQRLP